MFHSRGTVQSKAGVPLGTSLMAIGISCWMRRRVARRPSPVMLRQIGNSSSMRRCISIPAVAGSRVADLVEAFIGDTLPLRLTRDERIFLIALNNNSFAGRPFDAEGGIVPANPAGCVGVIELRHLIKNLSVVLESLETMSEAL